MTTVDFDHRRQIFAFETLSEKQVNELMFSTVSIAYKTPIYKKLRHSFFAK